VTNEDETLAARVAALEEAVADVQARLDGAVDRDIPLLKGTIRTAIDAEISSIGDLPDAGREFNRRVDTYDERLEELEQQAAALGDIETAKTTKEQKLAAILRFAENKRGQQAKVAVTADEIQGCVGVSRWYAYDLIDDAAELVDGMRVREATDVQTSTGVEHKNKALLIDCERVHEDGATVDSFTTRNGGEDGRRAAEISQEGDH